MEIRQVPRVAVGESVERKYLSGDYSVFWTLEELMEYINTVRSRVILPPKIRRQAPKPSRTHHVNKQVYERKESSNS